MAPRAAPSRANLDLLPRGRQPPGPNMTFSDAPTGAGELALQSRKIKRSPFLVLAAGLLLFAAIAAGFLLALRPATLRIAVGPAGSNDQNLIQALAEKFARDHSSVRLIVIPTAGPVESIAALSAHKAELAVARDDEELPDGTDSVAILRKNVVVLWRRRRARHRRRTRRKSRPSTVSPAAASAWSAGPGSMSSCCASSSRNPASIPTRSRSRNSASTRPPRWCAIPPSMRS